MYVFRPAQTRNKLRPNVNEMPHRGIESMNNSYQLDYWIKARLKFSQAPVHDVFNTS